MVAILPQPPGGRHVDVFIAVAYAEAFQHLSTRTWRDTVTNATRLPAFDAADCRRRPAARGRMRANAGECGRESDSAATTKGPATSRGTTGLSVLTLQYPFFQVIADSMREAAAVSG